MSTVCHDSCLASEDVDQPRKNESIGNECCRTQLCEVTNKREREEDDHLEKDEVLNPEDLSTVRDSHHKCLQVLRDENDVCRDETDLGYRDRGEDGITHPRAVQGTTNI